MSLVLILLVFVACGCTTIHPTTQQVAKGGPLPRPVVVIGGYGDPGIGATVAAKGIRSRTDDNRFLAVHPGFAGSFEDAAGEVVDALERYLPSESDTETIEVDVVAISMGGLTARYAALPDGRYGEAKKRLNIARLYTICSPHSGAQMADRWAWADYFWTGKSMRTSSGFFAMLAHAEAGAAGEARYPIVQYARENDIMIGSGSALPPHLWDRGQVIWLDMPFWRTGHSWCYADKRIHRDIARRLQAEIPVAVYGP